MNDQAHPVTVPAKASPEGIRWANRRARDAMEARRLGLASQCEVDRAIDAFESAIDLRLLLV